MPRSARSCAAIVISTILAFAATTARANAQPVSGVGDDAIPVPKHGSVIRISGVWTSYDSRFGSASADGNDKKSSLFGAYSRDNLGVADIPRLAATQTSIQTLSGFTDFKLTLGKLEASGDVNRTVTPFQIDVGVTRRLSIGLLVPYVETKSFSKFVLNRNGGGANVGQNPAALESGTNARTANGAVLSQIATSRLNLTTEIARCADAAATGGGCAAIRANPSAAQSLITQSTAISSQLAALYGTATAAGAPLVPLKFSDAQAAIEAKLAALRTNFDSFASNAMTATTLPSAAIVIYGSTGLQSIAHDSAYGLAYDSLANGGRAGIGDIDMVATFLLFDSFRASQQRRLNATGRGLRTVVSGGWRFGTATGGRSGSPFDVPTGVGASALLLRTTTDLILSRHFWLSGTARYVKPLEDNVVARFYGAPDTSLFAPFVVAAASRKIGATTEFEIAPRASINSFFGLSVAYGIGRQAISTTQALVTPATGFDAILTTPATTVQVAQFGISFSTLGAFQRGHSRWPIEVLYSHGVTLSGSGGVTPAAVTDRAEMKIYTRFPRR